MNEQKTEQSETESVYDEIKVEKKDLIIFNQINKTLIFFIKSKP